MKQVLFIVGPTASGKTEISLLLARKLNAEIISADSMQIYKGLIIGTAKVDCSAYPDIPHHMIDILDPSEEFSVFAFREQVIQLIKEIHSRGKLPIIVGGSGLYVKALTDGIADHPGSDEAVRARLRQEVAENGLGVLHERLRKIDKEAAARINEKDERRIIRALEIYEQSEKTSSEWQAETVSLNSLGYAFLIVGIMRDREKLYKKVEDRVDAMIEEGLVDEVKNLDTKKFSKTTRQAVGYKELIEHLNGDISLSEAIDLIKKNTRHLVKKQLTWFRKEDRIQWFNVDDNTDINTICNDMSGTISEWMSE